MVSINALLCRGCIQLTPQRGLQRDGVMRGEQQSNREQARPRGDRVDENNNMVEYGPRTPRCGRGHYGTTYSWKLNCQT